MSITPRKLPLLATAAVLALATSFASAQTAERGTREEAKAMTEAALAHIKKVGHEQAFNDFTKDKANWTKKDLYVFTYDLKANLLSHGANEKLIGKNLYELKDQNGKQFMKDVVELAVGKGEGWVDYDWTNPTTKKVEGKSTYVRRIPGWDGGVSVGVYR